MDLFIASVRAVSCWHVRDVAPFEYRGYFLRVCPMVLCLAVLSQRFVEIYWALAMSS